MLAGTPHRGPCTPLYYPPSAHCWSSSGDGEFLRADPARRIFLSLANKLDTTLSVSIAWHSPPRKTCSTTVRSCKRGILSFFPLFSFFLLSFSHSRFCLSFFLFVLLFWVEIIRIFAWARQLNCLSTSVTAWNSVPRVLREFFLRVLRVPFFFFFRQWSDSVARFTG